MSKRSYRNKNKKRYHEQPSKRYTQSSEIKEKDVVDFIKEVNADKISAAQKILKGNLSNHIESLSKYEVTLRKYYSIHNLNDEKYQIIIPGIAAKIPQGSHKVRDMKMALFNALLEFPGREVIAKRMMMIDKTGKFNPVSVDERSSLELVRSSDQSKVRNEIAEELIKRGGFALDSLGGILRGANRTILELLAMGKNHQLLKLMIEKNDLYDLNTLYKTTIFPNFEKATPLMIYAQLDDLEAIKALVEEAKVNINETIESDGTKVNALSCARDNMLIAEYLISKGSEYHGTTVGLTQRALCNGDYLETMYKCLGGLEKLLSDRAYYEKSNTLIDKIQAYEDKDETLTENKDKILKEVDNLCKQRKEDLEKYKEDIDIDGSEDSSQNQEGININEDEDLDTLLLQYFATKDENISDQIRDLCNQSTEASLELIASLECFDSPDVDSIVGDLISNPKLIHAYFQNKKSMVQAKMSSLVDDDIIDHGQGWKNGDEIIGNDNIISVKTSMHSNVYIKIEDELLANIPNSGFDNLKVISKNSLGVNGIKFRNDLGVIILKTKAFGDTRLVANEIFKNNQGDMLIIFKHQCNHNEVEKLSEQLNYHDVTDIFLNLSNEDNKDEFDILGQEGTQEDSI